MTFKIQTQSLLSSLGLSAESCSSAFGLPATTPIDGSRIGDVSITSMEQAQKAIELSESAFSSWRVTPAPVRGELIRLLGEQLRQHKEALGQLVSLETGKIVSEGLGEVQEMIDICDFAVGLSRQLYGKTIASERSGHRMMETWHPMGPCAIITAFNFPVAVWAWNAALALVCGNPVLWKPSEKTPLTALACQHLFEQAAAAFDSAPEGLSHILIGGAELGELLAQSKQVPIVSATGSTRMGRSVGPVVARRFGRCILELGGNNAMIVAPSADLDLATRAIVFSAVGTCGQRCTSLRRVIVHQSVQAQLTERLKRAYANLRIGNPLNEDTLVGPLIDQGSFDHMQTALAAACEQGGTVSGGKRVLSDEYSNGFYVEPALVEIQEQSDIVRTETFAPICYLMPYSELNTAIDIQNSVPQGLSSCIFTTDIREAELFMSAAGSDCGIANVNIGPSGAEIGGAFGGEKETGGGRESGSDAWKGYMRRATNTVNYSTELPLAQGVKFDI
jgi:aldehyde dehydrogenase (NAD+)